GLGTLVQDAPAGPGGHQSVNGVTAGRDEKQKPRRSGVLQGERGAGQPTKASSTPAATAEPITPATLGCTPAATAEPITPATLGPMACMSRKFCELASSPTLFDTRAAMGTAETPAEPISGLILVSLKRFMILAMITPAAVPAEKATMPSARMPRVFICRKASADSLEPTVRPRAMVT